MSPKIKNILFAVIVSLYMVYAGLFIFRYSFILNGQRSFILLDDAMISMRYARNLAQGYGLVWNPGGERIEGYTNPLWVGYMALFHLVPFERTTTSLFIQISGAVLLLANLFVVRAIAAQLSNGSWIVELGSVLLTAFYFPLNYWGFLGMEVCLLTLMVSTAVYLAIKTLQTRQFNIALYILLGISTLVRLDMSVIYFGVTAFMFITDTTNRKRHVIWGIGIASLFLGGQTLFRLAYFGELLPNTYYLKVEGVPFIPRLLQGIRTYESFFSRLGIIAFLVLIFRREKEIFVLVWLFALMSLYSIYVGGDSWEDMGGSNRFLSLVMPLYFILLSLTLVEAYLYYQARITKNSMALLAAQVSLALALSYSFVSVNLIKGVDSISYWLVTRTMGEHSISVKQAQRAPSLLKCTTPQAKVAVVLAGSLPYLVDREYIDLLGKMDKKIAHIAVSIEDIGFSGMAFRPGHVKYDPPYSLDQLKPDVIMDTWGDITKWQPYLDRDYRKVSDCGFYARLSSTNVLHTP